MTRVYKALALNHSFTCSAAHIIGPHGASLQSCPPLPLSICFCFSFSLFFCCPVSFSGLTTAAGGDPPITFDLPLGFNNIFDRIQAFSFLHPFFPLLLFLFTYILLVAARSAPSIVMRWSATYVRPVKACETTCPNISSANWTLGIFPGTDDIYNSCWGVRAVSMCQAIEKM